MDTQQTNRVRMFRTVTLYLDNNGPVWNSMDMLGNALADFKDKIRSIDAAVDKQETPDGATDEKASARDALEDVLFLTCEALGVLGHNANDRDLLALTSVTPSNLQKLDEEELSTRAARVLTEANARKADLVTLQVTQANLDELDQAVKNFNASKAGPRETTAERTAQTQSLSNLMREASGILRNQIDRMVNLFSRSNPDFVAGYRSARVIVDRAASHAATKAAGSPPTPNS